VLANDTDAQVDTFSITRIVSVSSGTATIENGQIRYTNGTRDAGTATIVYEITDSRGAKDTATVTVNIVADSNSVDAVDDVYTGTHGGWTAITPLANDTDAQGDAFSITSFENGGRGTYGYIINWGGQYYYINNGFNIDAVTDTIRYTITDSRGATDTATITIHIPAAPLPTETSGGGEGGGGEGGGGDCPLVIDFGAEGFNITNQNNSNATFDWNNDGVRTQTSWFSAEDGILAIDRNGDGVIENASEVFGNYNDANGFLALARLDSNGDGKIDNTDTSWSQIKLWFDGNTDGLGEAGELRTLDEMGVKAIHLNAVEVNVQQDGGYIPLISGVEMTDGTTRIIADVFFTNDATLPGAPVGNDVAAPAAPAAASANTSAAPAVNLTDIGLSVQHEQQHNG
jgi:hypothetical protein